MTKTAIQNLEIPHRGLCAGLLFCALLSATLFFTSPARADENTYYQNAVSALELYEKKYGGNPFERTISGPEIEDRIGNLKTALNDTDESGAEQISLELGALYERAGQADKAAVLYESISSSHNPDLRLQAFSRLGAYHLEKEEYNVALNYLKPAVKWRNPEALSALALMYYQGLGLNKSPDQAYQLFTQAAYYNMPEAQYYLAMIDYKGQGRPVNLNGALKWFGKAAERGHGKAMMNFGIMHLKGEATPQNKSEGYKWFALAPLMLDGKEKELALKARDRLKETLPRENIEEGTVLAADWLENHRDEFTGY